MERLEQKWEKGILEVSRDIILLEKDGGNAFPLQEWIDFVAAGLEIDTFIENSFLLLSSPYLKKKKKRKTTFPIKKKNTHEYM